MQDGDVGVGSAAAELEQRAALDDAGLRMMSLARRLAAGLLVVGLLAVAQQAANVRLGEPGIWGASVSGPHLFAEGMAEHGMWVVPVDQPAMALLATEVANDGPFPIRLRDVHAEASGCTWPVREVRSHSRDGGFGVDPTAAQPWDGSLEIRAGEAIVLWVLLETPSPRADCEGGVWDVDLVLRTPLRVVTMRHDLGYVVGMTDEEGLRDLPTLVEFEQRMGAGPGWPWSRG